MKKLMLTVLLMLWGAQAYAAPAAPAATVDALHAALVASMKDGGKQPCTQRMAALKPVVLQAFDFGLLAQRVLRRHWDKLDDMQRGAFRRAIEQLAVATYASQFKSWNGESFEPGKASEQAGGWRVSSRLLRPRGEPVTFDYVLRESEGQWRIVNVIAAGVSDLAIRSAQYESVMRAQGFDTLLNGIVERSKAIAAECA